MTRILTIIALLFATPMLAACGGKVLYEGAGEVTIKCPVSGTCFSQAMEICQKQNYFWAKRDDRPTDRNVFRYKCQSRTSYFAEANERELARKAIAESKERAATAKLENRCVGFGYTRSTPQLIITIMKNCPG